MTFELSSQHSALRDQARAYAQTLAARAADIDRAADIPADVARDVAAFLGDDALATVIVLEEIAAASAAVATISLATSGGSPLGLAGLRGARAVDQSMRTHLALAAVALGIGRAAIDVALAELRRSAAAPGDVEKPHWVVADVATELDAARMLTYKAARTESEADIAIARLMASAAATRAVDAAIRIGGAAALTEGSLVERLSRDVRTLAVLNATEEDQRAIAAEGLLPH